MIDVDGVVIVHPDPQGWSAHIERDLGLPKALLQSAFFEPHWQDIILGRADDDKQANVDAARGEGWSAALWDGTRLLASLMAEAEKGSKGST